MKDASATGDGIKKIQDVADLRAWCGKLLTICRIHLVETKDFQAKWLFCAMRAALHPDS